MTGAVGILGEGRIATALMKRWGDCPDPESPALLGGGSPGASMPLEHMARRAEILVVDDEPAEALAVLKALRCLACEDVSVVSAVPGFGLARLREAAGQRPRLFRAVTNAGAIHGKGYTILCHEPGVPQSSIAPVVRLLERLGSVEVVPEDMLDAAVAVTASAAGFLALAMEGIAEGAVRAGLARDTAQTFVRQTAASTALLLRDHPGSPADLKDQVASPAGTTIEGLAVLEERAVRGSYLRAVERACGKKDRAS